MSILKIYTIPSPVLKRKSSPIHEINNKIIGLAGSIRETMFKYKNCVGIAAPQTGENIRLIVVDVSLYSKPFPNNGLMTMINPVIVSRNGKKLGREGCLSIPEFTGNVCRSEEITINALDLKGNKFTYKTSGFEAVVIQHEIDHLDGILFLDRVVSLKTDVFRRQIRSKT